MLALAAFLMLAPPAATPTLAWQPFSYSTHETPAHVVAGSSAVLRAPETPGRADGASVELWVLRLPATSAAPGVPTVYLHGGPGGSSAEHLEQPAFRALFDSLRSGGDVVMFDQRGCGRSAPSLLPAGAPPIEAGTLATRATFLDWLERASGSVRDRMLAAGHDPRQYTVPGSVADIDALRRALGVARINLVAHSYGTQLAQAYLREHPEAVARAVLVGPRGMDTALKLPAEADGALARIAALAHEDTTVAAHCPDLLATFDRVVARLDARPLTVELGGEGAPRALEVGGYALRFIVAKFYLNDPDNFRYLPKLLDEIDTGRKPWSLVFNLRQMLRGGMSFAWFTTDAASGVSAARAERIRSQAASARLLDAPDFPFPEIGRAWGMPDLGDGFRSPVRSDVPVLVVAGTLDGITPVEQARTLLPGFPNGRLLAVANGGHSSQLAAPGVAGAIAGFFAGRTPPDSAALPPVRFVPLVTPAR